MNIPNYLVENNADDDEDQSEHKELRKEFDKKAEVEEQFDPYVIRNDGDSMRFDGKEVKLIDTSYYDGKNTYAGQWVREMIESHELKDGQNTWLGYTEDNIRGVQEAGIEYDSLWQHAAFFGKSGFGKSTVLKNIMVQWAYMGHGFCFVDPKKDDINSLVEMLPESRLDDIVWVEPAAGRDKVAGMNFFDTLEEPGTPEHENEVSQIVDDFVALLRASNPSWGATMDAVAKAVARQLVRAEENYTIADMYTILSDEEQRNQFTEQYGNEIEQKFLTRLRENYDDEEFDPLLKRLRDWMDDRNAKRIVSHTESKINIPEIIDENKIMLVKLSNIPGDDIKSLITTSIVRRIWSAMRSRTNIRQKETKPFFLVMDEFNQLAQGQMNIKNIISKGRAFKLSLCIANQSPTQLAEDVQEEIFNNVKNLCTFNVGMSPSAYGPIIKAYDISPDQITDLGQYELLAKLPVGDKSTDGLLINTFPEYPPRRTRDEANKIIDHSLDKYGVSPDSDMMDDENLGLKTTSNQGTDHITLGDGDVLSLEQVLTAVSTASERFTTETYDDVDNWVHTQFIQQELTRYSDELNNDSVFANTLETVPTTLLEDFTSGTDTYYRLTTEGQQRAFTQDTGTSQTSGGIGHRRLLKESYTVFTKLGYDVTLPRQDGGEQPDGIAEPPIKPVKEAQSMAEAKQLENDLADQYSRLYELFGDETLSIEAESTTLTKPKQTIKNFSKAYKQGNTCVFVVKDGTVEHDDMGYYANRVYNIIDDPPFVRTKGDNGTRRFYNDTTNNALTLRGGSKALRKRTQTDSGQTAPTVWKDDGDRIILENPDGNKPLAIFKTTSDLIEASPTKLPYNYVHNQRNSEYEVRDKRDNLIETYPTKKALKQDYDIIPKPVIPENIFDDGYPTTDNWHILIIPDDTNPKPPQIYHGTNTQKPTMTPIIENDPDLEGTTQDTNTEIQNKEASTEYTETSDSETVPEPTVSTNADNIDTETRTTSETEDTNPAEDNTNYRTGFNEDGVGDNWTGGQAREDDKQYTMNDYETPEEKEDKRLHKEYEHSDTKETNNKPNDDSKQTDTETTFEDPFKTNKFTTKYKQYKQKTDEDN